MKSTQRVVAASMLFAPLLAACIGTVKEETGSRTLHSDATSSPTSRNEHRDLAPETVPTVIGDAIDVEVRQRSECRKVTTTPASEEVTTARHLERATLVQGVNLGSAGLLLGFGSLVALGGCTHTDDASPGNPHPQSQPCNSDQASSQRGVGYVTMGLAAIPTALFVYNALRARDSTETRVTEPLRDTGTWLTCITRPVSEKEVTLDIGGTRRTSRTGGRRSREV